MSYELTDAVFASSVPAPRRFTLLALAQVTRPGTTRSWPSVAHLVELTGMGLTTVKKHLTDLEADGYIKREHRHNTSTIYTINTHRLDKREWTPTRGEVEPPEDPPPGQYVDPFGPAEPDSDRQIPTFGGSDSDLQEPDPESDSDRRQPDSDLQGARSRPSGGRIPTTEHAREQVKEQVREQGGPGGTLPLDTPKPTQPKTSKRRRPETPLPDDWQPTDDHRIYAARYQLDVDREAERFRNHAAMKDRRVRDWNAAFRNWLDKAREFAPAANTVKPGQEAWRRYCEQ